MMQDLCVHFLNAITVAGISAPSQIIPDGQIHRFDNGKRNNKTAWYVFNGISGVFGDWRTGEKHWFYPTDIPHIKADLTELSRRSARLTELREKEFKQQRAQARVLAAEIWEKSREISVHPYLLNKAVRSFGLREYCTGGG